jgi:Fe-S cluster assembly protein SufD
MPLLDRSPAGEDRCFVALNAALQRDGAVVSLPDGVVIEKPIHLVFVTTGAAADRTFHLRNLVSLGAGAQVVLVVHYLSLTGDSYLTNAVTDIAIGANAHLELVTVERESGAALHLATVTARLAADARLRSHLFSLGAALARNEVDVALADRGAACDLFGLYTAAGKQHVDNQSKIDHVAPHCTSRQLYKGVLGGRARGVFNGTVIVRPNAQKSDANQRNTNLLLNDGAEMNTRPNLEIYANDVKCAHGSTVGRLDEDALFYLRSRGIDRRDARKMLARAFAQELITELPTEALREEVSRRIEAKVQHLEEAA